MKKKLITILLLILVICLTLALTACNKHKGEVGGGLWSGKPGSGGNNGGNNGGNGGGNNTPNVPLDNTPPQNLTISGGLANWDAVSGAETYDLDINGNLVTGQIFPSYDLLDMKDKVPSGKFSVKVRAVKGDEKTEFCSVVTYQHVGSHLVYPILSQEDNKIVWTASTQAKNVEIVVNEQSNTVAGDTAEFDLSTLSGDSTISVKFVGDGVYDLDSQALSVIYKAETGKIHLPQPKNAKMDGSTLAFDEVLGANIYYLQDVNNTVTQITEFESSRVNKFLIKAIWAGNTDVEIENSLPVDVQYFGADEGLGTEESPYLISTADELRYIEFYESVNQAKYYKFANDIVLEDFTPANDVEYANFINPTTLALCGVIDGDGHKLINCTVYSNDGYSSMFDSILKDGVIKNLIIENANWRTWTVRTNDGVFHEKGGECAILAYENYGTVQNVSVVNSKIYAVQDGAAALVSVNKGTISDCVVDKNTTIYGANEAGGIAIFNSGTITNCINNATVSGNKIVGGIVGRNNGTVRQCGNHGNVEAKTFGGGIVGYNYNLNDGGLKFQSTISECYNVGEIAVSSYGGGIAGKNGSNGYNETGSDSYANAGIFSCYNTGKISGSNCLGGIVGDNYSYHEKTTDLGVVNCYNSGELAVDTASFTKSRVYVDFSGLDWDVTIADAVFNFYYWKDGQPDLIGWPGVRLSATKIGAKTYYYADLEVTASDFNCAIVTRCSPDGTVWNQTYDFKQTFTEGNLLFKITQADNEELPRSWNATVASSATLVQNATISAGGIAGFSNMINDSYFVAGTAGGKTLAACVANGAGQTGAIRIGSSTATSTACSVTQQQLTTTLLTTLNAYSDVWASGENGPILKWQQSQEANQGANYENQD